MPRRVSQGRKRKSYYIKKRLASVRDAILLHLLEHYRAQWPGDLPFAVSQEGVAEGVEGHRGHVSRILRELIEDGLVYQDVGRVTDVPTRVKTYHLTEEGAGEAVRIAEEVRGTVLSIAGEEGKLPMAELEERYAGRARLLDLALHTVRRIFDPVDFEAWLADREQFVEGTDRMPKVRAFYGRQEELDALDAWFVSETADTVAIRGIPGIGKTSLGAKFVDLVRESTNTFWATVETWTGASNVFRDLGEFDSAMGEHALSAHVRSRPRVDLTHGLLLLERELKGRKALLVFDDVHKANDRVRQLLEGLLRMLPRAQGPKVLLLGRDIPKLYDRRDVKVRQRVQELELTGLDPKAGAALLESRGIPAGMVPDIVKATGGHPFFLELFEEGADVAAGDFRRFIQEEVHARLEPSEARILGLASLYRTPVFSQGLLLPEGASYTDIQSLTQRGLLRETKNRQYEVHDLLKEFLAETLSEADRVRHHEAAAEYNRLLGTAADNLEAIHHFLEAGRDAEAVQLAVSRGREVLDKTISTEFLTLLDRVLETGPEGEDLGELLLIRSATAYHAGDSEGSLGGFEAALAVAEEVGNEYKAAEALRCMGRIRLRMSEHEQATDLLMASLQVSRRVKDLTGLAQTYGVLGKLHTRKGPFSKAKRHLDLAQKWAERSRDKVILGKILMLQAQLEGRRGADPTVALELDQQALELFREEDRVFELARAYHNLGVDLAALGRTEEAIDHFKRSLELCRKCGAIEGQAAIMQSLAGLFIRQSRLTDVEGLLDEALEIRSQLKDRMGVAMLHLHYAGLYQQPEEHELALQHIEKSVRDLEELGEWAELVRANVYKGEVLQHIGRAAEASKAFDSALDWAGRIDDPRLRATVLRQAKMAMEGQVHMGINGVVEP